MFSLKKLIFTLTVFCFLSASLAAPFANAQNWWSPTFTEFETKVNSDPKNEIFGERYTVAQVNWIINSLVYIFTGRVAKCTLDLNPDAISACLQESNGGGGPILALAGAIDNMKSVKPASGVNYIAQKGRDLQLIKTANAQGYGYASSLAPVQGLWLIARNAAYLMMTLAVVILAFLVMIRSKISPQATVTIQSALPRVAIALLFITFSYAIAGLLVDLTFVAQGVVGAIVAGSGLSNKTAGDLFNGMNNGISSLVSFGVSFILQSLAGGGILAQLANAGVFGNILISFDSVLSLLIFLLLLIALAKIFWLLLRTYVSTIFLVIAAPLIGIQYVISPGSNAIGTWIKNLVSQMAVFFAVGGGILLIHILFFSFGNGQDVIWSGIVGGLLQANPFGIQAQSVNGGAGILPSGFSFQSTASLGFFSSLVLALSLPKFASSMRDMVASGRSSYAPGGFRDMAGPFAGAALGSWALGKKAVSAPINKAASEFVTPGVEKTFEAASRAAKGVAGRFMGPGTTGSTRGR